MFQDLFVVPLSRLTENDTALPSPSHSDSPSARRSASSSFTPFSFPTSPPLSGDSSTAISRRRRNVTPTWSQSRRRRSSISCSTHTQEGTAQNATEEKSCLQSPTPVLSSGAAPEISARGISSSAPYPSCASRMRSHTSPRPSESACTGTSSCRMPRFLSLPTSGG